MTTWPALQPLTRALAQGIPPLVLLSGTEGFLVREALDLLKSALFVTGIAESKSHLEKTPSGDECEAERVPERSVQKYMSTGSAATTTQAPRAAFLEMTFNSDWFSAKDAAAMNVLAAARTLPMLAPMRLVVVREAEAWSAAEWNALIPYLEKPSPTTCLCVLASKVDARLKGIQAWKKHGLLVPLEPLTERQLPEAVRTLAQRKGLRLGSEGVQRIVEQVGADLGLLDSTLERLACYAQPGRVVTQEEIAQVTQDSREETAFVWVDALAAGNLSESLRLMHKQAEQGEAALKLLALWARHVRLLLRAHQILQKSSNPPAGEAAKQLGVPPFVVFKLLDQAKQRSLEQLLRLHAAVYHTDRALKQTRLSEWVHLQALILQTCQP